MKLHTSGFSQESVRRIVMSGIRGYDGRVRRYIREGRGLYRTAAQSSRNRLKKKLFSPSKLWVGVKCGAPSAIPKQKPRER